jgi:hypothetical protein
MIARNPNWQIVLTICIIVLLANNVLMAISLVDIKKILRSSAQHDPLPCKAVPVQFVIEEPYCANKLLESMKINNVFIIPTEDFGHLQNETIFRFQNQSERNK